MKRFKTRKEAKGAVRGDFKKIKLKEALGVDPDFVDIKTMDGLKSRLGDENRSRSIG